MEDGGSSNDEEDVVEEYRSSLEDLTFNSKPLINVLTMLAEENMAHGDSIVKTIKERIEKVNPLMKMASLYLLDSILKNVGKEYRTSIPNYIKDIFIHVFTEGDEKIKVSLFKLRHTWTQHFTPKLLYELDSQVHEHDPNWPVPSQPPPSPTIHVNPRFLKQAEDTAKPVLQDPGKASIQTQEKRLQEEERRIQEQLRKLQEAKHQIEKKRQEEQRKSNEIVAKKQQEEREKLLQEQKKRIMELKQEDEAVPPPNDKVQPSCTSTRDAGAAKPLDPRLQRRQIAAVGDNVKVQTKEETAENREGEQKGIEQDPVAGQALGSSKKAAQKQNAGTSTKELPSEKTQLEAKVVKPSVIDSSRDPRQRRTAVDRSRQDTANVDSGGTEKRSRENDSRSGKTEHEGLEAQKNVINLNRDPRQRKLRPEVNQDQERDVEGRGEESERRKENEERRNQDPRLQKMYVDREQVDKPHERFVRGGHDNKHQRDPRLERRQEERDVAKERMDQRRVIESHGEDGDAMEVDDGRYVEGNQRDDRQVNQATFGRNNNDHWRPMDDGRYHRGFRGMDRTRDKENEEHEGPFNNCGQDGPPFKRARGREEGKGGRFVENQSDDEEHGPGRVDDFGFDEPRGQRGRHPKRRLSAYERKITKMRSREDRRKMVPKEKELPPELRMEHHKSLMGEIEMRLKSGALTEKEHDNLVSQLELLYRIQRNRQDVTEIESKAKMLKEHRERTQLQEHAKNIEQQRVIGDHPPVAMDTTHEPPRHNFHENFSNDRPPVAVDTTHELPRHNFHENFNNDRPPVAMDTTHEPPRHNFHENFSNDRPPESLPRPNNPPMPFERPPLNENRFRPPERFPPEMPFGRPLQDLGPGPNLRPERWNAPMPRFEPNVFPGGRDFFENRPFLRPDFHPERPWRRHTPPPFHGSTENDIRADMARWSSSLEDPVLLDPVIRGDRLRPDFPNMVRREWENERERLDHMQGPRHQMRDDMHFGNEGIHRAQENMPRWPDGNDNFHGHPDFGRRHSPVRNQENVPPMPPPSFPLQQIPPQPMLPQPMVPPPMVPHSLPSQPTLPVPGNDLGALNQESSNNLLTGGQNSMPNMNNREGQQGLGDVLSGLLSKAQPSSQSSQGSQTSFVGVTELFNKLVNSGIISLHKEVEQTRAEPTRTETPPPQLPTEEETIPEIKINIESLRKRHVTVINKLYKGTQCASCGLRFLDDAKEEYAQHLDWHFKQNKRQKDNSKASSRTWYIPLDNWITFDGEVDLPDQVPSAVFEDDVVKFEHEDSEDITCSVEQVEDDDICDVCCELFEQFWDEEREEWRYRGAVRVNGRTYHYHCYKDSGPVELEAGSEEDMDTAESQPVTSSPANDISKEDTAVDECAVVVKQEEVEEDEQGSPPVTAPLSNIAIKMEADVLPEVPPLLSSFPVSAIPALDGVGITKEKIDEDIQTECSNVVVKKEIVNIIKSETLNEENIKKEENDR